MFIIIEWFTIKLLVINVITLPDTALYACISSFPLVIKDIIFKTNLKHQNIWNIRSFKGSFILNGLIPSLLLYLISNLYQTLIICWYLHYLYQWLFAFMKYFLNDLLISKNLNLLTHLI